MPNSGVNSREKIDISNQLDGAISTLAWYYSGIPVNIQALVTLLLILEHKDFPKRPPENTLI